MKIIMIQCPHWTIRNPPYNLSLLKAVTVQRGHEVFNFDFNIELYHAAKRACEKTSSFDDSGGSQWSEKDFIAQVIKKYGPYINDIVDKLLGMPSTAIGFTINANSKLFSIEFAKLIKEKAPEKIIIFGGPECYKEASPKFDLRNELYLDAVCTGEGEICLGNMLDIVEQTGRVGFCKGFIYRNEDGGITDCGDPDIVQDLDSLPFVDYSDFDLKKYTHDILPVMTSKGCVYKCTFCGEAIRMKKFRTRTGQNVYSEIKYQLEEYPFIKEFIFADSLLNGDIKMLGDLCDLIIKNGIRITWGGQAAIRKEMSKDFLIKLKQAGCVFFGFGVESGSNKILRLMNKNFTAELAERVIRDSYAAGIEPDFNIIVGFPQETESEFQETLNFLKRNAIYAKHIRLSLYSITAHSEISNNRAKWGIMPEGSGLYWESIDGSNNYEKRLNRLEIYKTILKEKAHFDNYKSATAGNIITGQRKD